MGKITDLCKLMGTLIELEEGRQADIDAKLVIAIVPLEPAPLQPAGEARKLLKPVVSFSGAMKVLSGSEGYYQVLSHRTEQDNRFFGTGFFLEGNWEFVEHDPNNRNDLNPYIKASSPTFGNHAEVRFYNREP